MNDEILQGIIETQNKQTETIQELLEICKILKDRVEALEKGKKQYLPASQLKDIPIIRIDGDGYTGGIEVQGKL